MNQEKIKYICSKMLEVNWAPKLTQHSMNIFDKCDSLLEIMYLFGAIHFLEMVSQRANNMAVGEWEIATSKVIYEEKEYEGIYFHGVWPLWIEEIKEDCGPQSILFVPQLKFGPDYHQDFGIFYGDECGSSNSWELRYGIEVDGYIVHKKRREKDKFRDSIANHTVIRLLEEIHNPLKWFRLVMEKDSDLFWKQIEENSEQSN